MEKKLAYERISFFRDRVNDTNKTEPRRIREPGSGTLPPVVWPEVLPVVWPEVLPVVPPLVTSPVLVN